MYTCQLMRFVTAIFCLLSLAACESQSTMVPEPAVQEESDAQKTTQESASPRAAQPKLAKDVFAERLKDEFYQDSAEEVDEIQIDSIAQRELILDNLAHLPSLRRIEFSRIAFSQADIEKIARFPGVKEIEFSSYGSLDPAVVSPLKSLEGISFYRCNGVRWQRLKEAQLPRLRRLKLQNLDCSGDDLQVLVGISAIEDIELSSLNGINDDDLNHLARLENLKSLSVYNCRNVRGAFLDQLKDRVELQEFNYTGTISPFDALQVTAFSKLQSVYLNLKEPLEHAWYAALAKNCKQLARLTLIHQVMDKKKLDLLSSLAQLTELQLHSGSEHAIVSGRGTRVDADEGAFVNISQLKMLTKLHVSGQYTLNADDGAAITSLGRLNDLEFRGVVFKDGVFERLDRLVDLHSLSINGSEGLGPADARQIGTLAKLETLNLSNISTRKADFSALKGLGRLKDLDVRDYRNLNDSDMAFAEGMKSLEKLSMKNNFRVTDKGIAHLRHAKRLRTLLISRSNISGKGFADWPADHSIESILIEGSSIGNEGLKAISRFQNLLLLEVRVLRAFGGNIEVDVACFANSPSLVSLALPLGYVTTQDSLDRLVKARPKLGVSVRIKQ